MAPITATPQHPFVLIIMDGWGIRKQKANNAIANAHKPFFDSIWKKYPHTVLDASGMVVGLPPGYIGNSEVGHTHIGAGRLIPQEFMRINLAIRHGSFFRNRALLEAVKRVRHTCKNMHLMGLVSDGGVHSHLDHLFALLLLAKKSGLQGRTFVHCFLDGRDVPPKSAKRYLVKLEQFMRKNNIGEIASISGRYYAMDRDNRWKRTRVAYRALAQGKGYKYTRSLDALHAAYRRRETDEFVKPSVIQCKAHTCTHHVNADDSIIFFNFRADRARQLTHAFIDDVFIRFKRERISRLHLVCMTQYDKKIHAPVAFPPSLPKNTLGEIISRHGLRQLRIAETEKYAHVTYFFNNGRERPFPKEDRVLIPSPKVATYDTTPAMSAPKITRRVIAELEKRKYPFIVINFANADMVGHTGKFSPTVKAIEVIDNCLRQIATTILQMDGQCIITADHGNAEEEAGVYQTSHTVNPVPCILVSKKMYRLRQHGTLQNIAPTALQLIGIPKPKEMVESFIIHREGE
ncbi:2,3-bisphosphoglycerate-independent phosphoglycerate mutase [Candidatus Woesearchaeota archaeon]|nr:2,3-bisphosphoglycerate-independent phosphoglycerate mutase [Candidatus Woesearchaeota archaeon]